MKCPTIDPGSRSSVRLKTEARMPHAQTTSHYNKPPVIMTALPPRKRADWPKPPASDYEPENEPQRRGERAVLHGEATRGRRSKEFPDLNITATAKALGVSKSHLAKVLAGFHRPSVSLAVRLADVLGKDVMYVIALYNRDKKGKED